MKTSPTLTSLRFIRLRVFITYSSVKNILLPPIQFHRTSLRGYSTYSPPPLPSVPELSATHCPAGGFLVITKFSIRFYLRILHLRHLTLSPTSSQNLHTFDITSKHLSHHITVSTIICTKHTSHNQGTPRTTQLNHSKTTSYLTSINLIQYIQPRGVHRYAVVLRTSYLHL